MEILTSLRRLYISFKSLVNDFVYSFGRAALLLLVKVWNHTVPVRERRRITVNDTRLCSLFQYRTSSYTVPGSFSAGAGTVCPRVFNRPVPSVLDSRDRDKSAYGRHLPVPSYYRYLQVSKSSRLKC